MGGGLQPLLPPTFTHPSARGRETWGEKRLPQHRDWPVREEMQVELHEA